MSVKSTKMANKDKIKSTLKRKIEDSGSEETMNKKSVKKHKETSDDIEPGKIWLKFYCFPECSFKIQIPTNV